MLQRIATHKAKSNYGIMGMDASIDGIHLFYQVTPIGKARMNAIIKWQEN
jgi:hypothetical protein